ncbi:MAG TPA: ATP-binding protein [Draconibacterium sp.]|nr:ATP-binding protein [Draconibacterium sp.]
MNNIKREHYLKKIHPFVNQPLIKVLIGQRRVGKSYLLKQIMEEILLTNPNANTIFIDKEKYEFDAIQNYHHLVEFVKNRQKEGWNYLFIDEIQEIEGFEKALRSLLSDGFFDIYCTGSNANMLSTDIATVLSGRQIVFEIYSLSFTEFCQFHQLARNSETLNLYLKYGGLPYLIHLPKQDEIIFEYLDNIYATILFRDIISRNEIRDVSFLNNLLRFLADNTGSLVSAKKISDYLKSQQSSKSVSVILNYISYLENAYFIFKVKRKDIQGKKIFEIGEKYYFEDFGLRNSVNGYKSADINKITENAVYLHLLINGYKIFIGKTGDKEIDFIAERQNELLYVQVTSYLTDEKVIEREFGNLLSVPDNYPKLVVSLDEFSGSSTYKGIQHLTLLEFLSESI